MQNNSGPLINQVENNSKYIFTKRRISTDRMKKKLVKNNLSFDRNFNEGPTFCNNYPLNPKNKFINRKRIIRDNFEYPNAKLPKNLTKNQMPHYNQRISESLLNPSYLVNEYKNAIKEKSNLINILKDLIDIPSQNAYNIQSNSPYNHKSLLHNNSSITYWKKFGKGNKDFPICPSNYSNDATQVPNNSISSFNHKQAFPKPNLNSYQPFSENMKFSSSKILHKKSPNSFTNLNFLAPGFIYNSPKNSSNILQSPINKQASHSLPKGSYLKNNPVISCKSEVYNLQEDLLENSLDQRLLTKSMNDNYNDPMNNNQFNTLKPLHEFLIPLENRKQFYPINYIQNNNELLKPIQANKYLVNNLQNSNLFVRNKSLLNKSVDYSQYSPKNFVFPNQDQDRFLSLMSIFPKPDLILGQDARTALTMPYRDPNKIKTLYPEEKNNKLSSKITNTNPTNIRSKLQIPKDDNIIMKDNKLNKPTQEPLKQKNTINNFEEGFDPTRLLKVPDDLLSK